MKRTKFTVSQIVGILKEQEQRKKGRRHLPGIWYHSAHTFSLEEQVCRHGSFTTQASEGTGSRVQVKK